MATIAISHRAVRLRALQRMAEKGRDPGNMVLTASLMKQAAEEVGNAYTNRHELTGKDGKDLPVRVSPGYRATIWMRSVLPHPRVFPENNAVASLGCSRMPHGLFRSCPRTWCR